SVNVFWRSWRFRYSHEPFIGLGFMLKIEVAVKIFHHCILAGGNIPSAYFIATERLRGFCQFGDKRFFRATSQNAATHEQRIDDAAYGFFLQNSAPDQAVISVFVLDV